MSGELEQLFEAWDRETLDEAGRARLNAALDQPEARRAWFEHLHFTAACHELLREAPALVPEAATEAAEPAPLARVASRENAGTPWWLAAAALVALAAGLLFVLLGRPSMPRTASDREPVRSLGGENEKPAPERTPEEGGEDANLDALLAGLSDADAEKREAASRALIARGREVLPRLRLELERAREPDLRARLKEAMDVIARPIAVLTMQNRQESDGEFRHIKDMLDGSLVEFTSVACRFTGIVEHMMPEVELTPDRKLSSFSGLPVLDEFDVLVIGDIIGFCTRSGDEELEAFVVNGGRLVLIADKGQKAAHYSQDGFGKLLPVELVDAPSGDRANDVTRTIVRTQQGMNHPITRLTTDEEANKAAWKTFPKVHWIAPVARAKPNAVVLLEEDATHTPVLTLMRYGKGTVCYLATDELWRWHKDGNEENYNRFYRNLLDSFSRKAANLKELPTQGR